jgi:hypothetical protein
MSFLRPGIRALFALFFLLSGLPQGVLVVCIADDGHLALEMPIAHGPAVAAAAAAVAAEGACTARADAARVHDLPCACGDDCGTCSDQEVSLAVGLRAVSESRFDAAPLSPLPAAIAPRVAPSAALLLPHAARVHRLPSSWQQFQQGIVLRI